jgi:hypothetical protein
MGVQSRIDNLPKSEVVVPVALSAADLKILDGLRGALTRECCLALLLRLAGTGAIVDSTKKSSSEVERLRLQISNLTFLLKKEMALTEKLTSRN